MDSYTRCLLVPPSKLWRFCWSPEKPRCSWVGSQSWYRHSYWSCWLLCPQRKGKAEKEGHPFIKANCPTCQKLWLFPLRQGFSDSFQVRLGPGNERRLQRLHLIWLTLCNERSRHEEKARSGDSRFAKVLSIRVNNREDNVDRWKNKQTIIEVEYSFEMKASLPPFLYWSFDHSFLIFCTHSFSSVEAHPAGLSIVELWGLHRISIKFISQIQYHSISLSHHFFLLFLRTLKYQIFRLLAEANSFHILLGLELYQPGVASDYRELFLVSWVFWNG